MSESVQNLMEPVHAEALPEHPIGPDDLRRIRIAKLVLLELESAERKHPPFPTAHHGYAVMLEELDELWELVKQDRGCDGHAVTEAIQIAATAMRYVINLSTLEEQTYADEEGQQQAHDIEEHCRISHGEDVPEDPREIREGDGRQTGGGGGLSNGREIQGQEQGAGEKTLNGERVSPPAVKRSERMIFQDESGRITLYGRL
jgi:hypothetical protein